jgi:hypothetical protein
MLSRFFWFFCIIIFTLTRNGPAPAKLPCLEYSAGPVAAEMNE